MAYCCYIWNGAAQFSLSYLDSSKAITCPYSPFPQTKCRKVMATLSLLQWHIFKWAPLFNFTSSDLYGQNPLCYLQCWIIPIPCCGTDSWVDAFLNTRILISSCLWLIVIYPAYPRNPYLLFLHLTFRSHNRFRNALSWLIPGQCIGWTFIKKILSAFDVKTEPSIQAKRSDLANGELNEVDASDCWFHCSNWSQR